MSSSQYQEEAFINSIIGEGTRFRGEFDLNGLLRIDGDFSGTIRTKGKVLVGSNGRAVCTIYGGTVVVGGIVNGNIFATEKVILLSTGMMIGNILTPRLIIEEGVLFNGNCRIETPQHSARKNTVSSLKKEKDVAGEKPELKIRNSDNGNNTPHQSKAELSSGMLSKSN
ncbi:MAG: polymer-forming cytoskeletal family protein [Spirochaetes bacterium]|nr:polymer-forming cytoskeletal family protein [Spirochaetota bacterium]